MNEDEKIRILSSYSLLCISIQSINISKMDTNLYFIFNRTGMNISEHIFSITLPVAGPRADNEAQWQIRLLFIFEDNTLAAGSMFPFWKCKSS